MKTLFIVIIAIFMVGCNDASKSKDNPEENIGLNQGTQPVDSNNTQLDTDNDGEVSEDLPKEQKEIKQPVAPKIKNEKLRPPSIPIL